MKQYLVQVRQNMLACDTIWRSSSTQRTMSESLFNTEEEAQKYYEQMKMSFRFAGLAGQYVTYPLEVTNYHIFDHHCDCCGEGFDNEAYADLNGDFCSRTCFRNNFQAASEGHYDEEQYYDDY